MNSLSNLPVARLLPLEDPHKYGPALRPHMLANHIAAALLVELAPDIANLVPNADFPLHMRRAVLDRIGAQPAGDTRVAVHRAVDRVLMLGNKEGLWSIPSLGAVAQHALQPSPFTVKDASAVRAAEQLRARLDQSLAGILEDGRPLLLRAAFCLSLVLHDALQCPNLVELAAVGELSSARYDELAWLRFEHSASTRTGPRCRRWIAGERSAALLARCEALPRDATKMDFASGMAALSAVIGVELPRSAQALVRKILPFWCLHLPPALQRLAASASATESLPDPAHQRLVDGVRLAHSRSPSLQRTSLRAEVTRSRRELLATLTPPSNDQSFQLRALAKLRAALYHRPRTPQPDKDVLQTRFDNWHRDYGAAGGWVSLMAHWSRAVVLDPRTRGNGRNLALNSAKRYLVSVGNWMVMLAGDLDPAQVTEPELMARLETLRLAIAGQVSAAIAHVALVEILAYWEDCGGVRIDLTDWWGVPPRDGKPDANLLTPLEYIRLLAWIDQLYSLKPNCHAHRRARATAIMAFRLGARWGELRTLHTSRVRVLGRPGQEEISILISDDVFADLKSAFSERRLWLDQLLPAAELAEVTIFIADVMGGRFWNVSGEGAFVFAEPEAPHMPPLPEQTRDLVQQGMRHVSGDQSLVFHHLRHSLANWLELRLLSSGVPGLVERWPNYGEVASSAFDFSSEGWPSYGAWLTGRPDYAHSAPYILSGVLGQLDGEVSYTHYVHLSEISVYCATRAAAMPLTGLALAAVRGWKSPATGHQAAWRAKRNRATQVAA